MIVETSFGKVTKSHLKILRSKKISGLHINHITEGVSQYQTLKNGYGEIIVIEGDDPDHETVHRLGSVKSSIFNYSDENNTRASAFISVFPNAHNPDIWLSIANHIQEGDEISLLWFAANNNSYLRDAGLCHDEVFMVIEREKRGKKTSMRFFLGDKISPQKAFHRWFS